MRQAGMMGGLLLALSLGLALSIWGQGFSADATPSADELARLIFWELRLPRALLGVIVGAGLGASGAVLQGYFRNPLADPGVVGVSASSGLGAVLALYFGWTSASIFALPVAAILAAGLGVAGLLLLAGRQAGATTLILAGIAIGALANALTALLMNMSPNPWALSEIAYWLMGSLGDASWTEFGFAAPFVVTGLIMLTSCRRSLDLLSLGEEAARSLGLDPVRVRVLVVGGTALAVGAGVAVAGAIGFVGLVVPHLLRRFAGYQPGALILPSAIGGAVLLIFADLAVRWLSGPGMPLYLGVLTALLGAPFFLWLVRSTRRQAP